MAPSGLNTPELSLREAAERIFEVMGSSRQAYWIDVQGERISSDAIRVLWYRLGRASDPR